MRLLPRVVALFVLCAVAPTVRADEIHPRHALHLGVGLGGEAVREDLMVPLGFAGVGLRLLAGLETRLGPGRLAFHADVSLAPLFNRFGHKAAAMAQSYALTWAGRVFWGKTFHLDLGPALVAEHRVAYLFAWDDAHAYWFGTEWLGPHARLMARLGESWRLEGSGSLAIVGFAGRPPTYRYNKQDALNQLSFYFAKGFHHQRFASILDLQAVRIDLAVRHVPYGAPALSSTWAYGLDLRAAHADFPATVIALSVYAYARRSFAW